MDNPLKKSLKGVAVLSTVTLLERFAFYLLMAVIIPFLTDDYGLSFDSAASYFWLMVLLNTLLPVVGGLLGDLIDYKKILLISFLLSITGFAFLSLLGVNFPIFIVLAFVFICLGHSLLTVNVIVLIGNLMDNKGQVNNSTAGFMLLYAAINSGAILAANSSNFLKTEWGYASIIYICIAVMILSTLVYLIFNQTFSFASIPFKQRLKEKPYFMYEKKDKEYLIYTLLIIMAVAIPIQIISGQSSTTISFFIRDFVENGIELGPGMLQWNIITSTVLYIALAILLLLKNKLKLHNTLTFIFSGIFVLSTAFLILIISINETINPLVITSFFVLSGVAEVLISAFIIYLIYRAAPLTFRATFGGIVLMMNGLIDRLHRYSIEIYSSQGPAFTFTLMAIIGIVCAVVIFVLRQYLKRRNIDSEEV